MNKIVLKGVNTKGFTNLIKRSSVMDNLMFITINGTQFESTAYTPNRTAVKSVIAELTKLCAEYTNDCDEAVKIQFSNASKVIQVLGLVGTENVDIIIDVENDNYAKKVLFKNETLSINVNCADAAALVFLEIPDEKKEFVIYDNKSLSHSFSITESEYKYMSSLFNLNKDTLRVFFNIKDSNVFVSEIESSDENVRAEVNEIIEHNEFDSFETFEKLYSKKLSIEEYDNKSDDDKYLGCFNKKYFEWIDNDNKYTIEFHNRRIKIISSDDELGIKSYVILGVVRFA